MTAQGDAERLGSNRESERSERVVSLGRGAMSEAQLVFGLVDRQPRAIAELFDRYADLLRGLLTRTLGSERDVDDLVQETFLTVIRRARDLHTPESLRSFVVSVALRTAKNELRKRAVRRWVGLDDVAELPLPTVGDAVVRDRVRRVYAALDRLDSSSRLLFVLRYVEGFELTEVAEATQCSLSTVKRRLARVRKRFETMASRDPVLRELMEEPT